MIADRPTEVGDRVQVGRWEGDCIMGTGNRSAIGTLVERTTRFVILIHVPTGRPTAAAMCDGITDTLGLLHPIFDGRGPGIRAKSLPCITRSLAAPARACFLRRTLAVGARQQRERLAPRRLPQSH